MAGRLMIVGFDGGTWEVIDRGIEQGTLPTFRRIIEEGCRNDLRSTIPSITSPAWKCLTTGRLPSQLGAYWWAALNREEGEIDFHTSGDYHGKELWDILGFVGKRSLAINIPTTFPPNRINGSMISGPIIPEDSVYTYPEELAAGLDKRFGYTPKEEVKLSDDQSKGTAEIIRKNSQLFEISRSLRKGIEPDLTFLTIFLTDTVQHELWTTRNDPGNRIMEVWEAVDSKMADLLAELEAEGTPLIIVSDHGFTEMKARVHINQWLMENGYIVLKERIQAKVPLGTRIYRRIRSWLRRHNLTGPAKRVMGKKVRQGLAKRAQAGQEHGEEAVVSFNRVMELIDHDESKAVCFPDGPLYILNRDGTDIDGLIKGLASIVLPDGTTPIRKAWRTEELYASMGDDSGDLKGSPPDLVLEMEMGYDLSGGLRRDGSLTGSGSGWTGTHRREGIFMAWGEGIRHREFEEPFDIIDLFPTVLRRFGIPAADDLKGKVMPIFEE